MGTLKTDNNNNNKYISLDLFESKYKKRVKIYSNTTQQNIQ